MASRQARVTTTTTAWVRRGRASACVGYLTQDGARADHTCARAPGPGTGLNARPLQKRSAVQNFRSTSSNAVSREPAHERRSVMWPVLLMAFVGGSTAFASLDAVQDTAVANSSSPESLGPDPFLGPPESLAALVREAPSAVIAEITASGDLKTVEVMVPHATRRSVRGFATYTVRIRMFSTIAWKVRPHRSSPVLTCSCCNGLVEKARNVSSPIKFRSNSRRNAFCFSGMTSLAGAS